MKMNTIAALVLAAACLAVGFLTPATLRACGTGVFGALISTITAPIPPYNHRLMDMRIQRKPVKEVVL